MAIQCKICANLTLLGIVTEELNAGASDKQVFESAHAAGYKISMAGLIRHRLKHHNENPTNTPVNRDKKIEKIDTDMRQGIDDALALMRDSENSIKSISLADKGVGHDSLLNRLYEAHLLAAISALKIFENGETRYPAEVIKGLQAIHSMYDKCALAETIKADTNKRLFDERLKACAAIVRESGKKSPMGDMPDIYLIEELTPFEFAGNRISGYAYNDLMRAAWREGNTK